MTVRHESRALEMVHSGWNALFFIVLFLAKATGEVEKTYPLWSKRDEKIPFQLRTGAKLRFLWENN